MGPFARLHCRSVIVNLSSGQAFQGVLWRKRGPLLTLRNVTLLERGGSTRVDGEVVIERNRVDFIQVLTP